MRHRHGLWESGFTLIELLVVVLLLGILIMIALPNYFGAEADTRRRVDQANVRAINSALALYKFNSAGGRCPDDTGQITFTAFLASTTFFPDGIPVDPHDVDLPLDGDDYQDSYSMTACRVLMTTAPSLNHATGAGHD